MTSPLCRSQLTPVPGINSAEHRQERPLCPQVRGHGRRTQQLEGDNEIGGLRPGFRSEKNIVSLRGLHSGTPDLKE